MECLPHQSQILHAPTGDDGDEDQDKRAGDAEPGRSASTHRPIPTHFQWNLVVDRRTISVSRPQDVRHVATSAVPAPALRAA